ncbi:MAG: hypothetical protein M3S32_04445 [Acidobacteriota bacterium]|nr:hypothetical protein [Acidobacteriota bacterium]
MKPDDANGKLPAAERPFRVLIVSGSNRREYNCPGVELQVPCAGLNSDDTLKPARTEGEKLR